MNYKLIELKKNIIKDLKEYSRYKKTIFQWKNHRDRSNSLVEVIEQTDSISKIHVIIQNEINLYDNKKEDLNETLPEYYTQKGQKQKNYSVNIKNRNKNPNRSTYRKMLGSILNEIHKAEEGDDRGSFERHKQYEQLHESRIQRSIVENSSAKQVSVLGYKKPKFETDAEFIGVPKVKLIYLKIMRNKLVDRHSMLIIIYYLRFAIVKKDRVKAFSLLTDIVRKSYMIGDIQREYPKKVHEALSAINAYSGQDIDDLLLKKNFRIIIDAITGMNGQLFMCDEMYSYNYCLFYFQNIKENFIQYSQQGVLKTKLDNLYKIVKITYPCPTRKKYTLLKNIKELAGRDKIDNAFWEEDQFHFLRSYDKYKQKIKADDWVGKNSLVKIRYNPLTCKCPGYNIQELPLNMANTNLSLNYWQISEDIYKDTNIFCQVFAFPILSPLERDDDNIENNFKFNKITLSTLQTLCQEYFPDRDDQITMPRHLWNNPIFFKTNKNKDRIEWSVKIGSLFEQTYNAMLFIHDKLPVGYGAKIHCIRYDTLTYEWDSKKEGGLVVYSLSLYLRTEEGNVYYIKNLYKIKNGILSQTEEDFIVFGIVSLIDNYKIFKYKNNMIVHEQKIDEDSLLTVDFNSHFQSL
ncbi:hypothetical protein IB642_02280 [Allofrancisella guangzhouensis]|uniref:Uncharacterized protein n=1 Tax=Allofrancisella guangzhouensis TaxID=594679 RepID=A0A0A8E452_9GAMM|nr:hypothetical protein [Allofrancisella guangzhouensis]AJC48387.1 hypothetical protein SD28_01285 [Allofrancisella guangzhouensis]MBK2026664.1 hypothetical protein [Allofrancisella guangzhouensis]MBK2043845.1 hypothetical protein [Allofrancisella guangzhouensis]MBK2045502.1 hypothetical protein [Allofrancisella guangzhouensis]